MLGENQSGLVFEKVKKEVLLNNKPAKGSFSINELNFQKYYEKERVRENFCEMMKFFDNIPMIQNKRSKLKFIILHPIDLSKFHLISNYQKFKKK